MNPRIIHQHRLAPSAAADASLRKLLPRMWQVFVGAWLIFLVATVASEARSHSSASEMLALVTWISVFATIWLWLMLRDPFRATEPAPTEHRLLVGLLVTLAGLVAYINLVYGPGLSWLFIYVLFATGIRLPTRNAVWAIALVVILGGAIGVVAGHWTEAVTQIPGVAAYGLAIVIVRRLVVTVRELDAARAEIAQLAAAKAVTAERLRFARDLHDLLGHSLSLIALKSELARRLAPTDHDRAEAEIADVEIVARQALREVREAVGGYRRPTLETELDAARDLLSAAGIDTRIEASVDSLPAGLDGVLAWTVREGVTNVIRHSRAQHCDIRITNQRDTVHAEIADDGDGVSTASPNAVRGNGLSGLAERFAEHGGQLATSAAGDDGFILRGTLPIPSAHGSMQLDGAHEQ